MSTPNSSSLTAAFAASGQGTIDPLLNEFQSKWYSSSGNGAALTYSFPWYEGAAAYWQNNYSASSEQLASLHFGLIDSEISAVTSAFQAWAAVSGVTFTQVAESNASVGDFRFAFSSAVSDGLWGWSYSPNCFFAKAADIWINPSTASDPDWSGGSFNFVSLLHEIGHGLGLKHPGNYGTGDTSPYLPADMDVKSYTIMSYNYGPARFLDTTLHEYIIVLPATPMVLDIAAIQYLYGSNNSYRSGDDTYTFDPSHPFYAAIWDAGGRDTINLQNFITDCDVDLTSGHYSSIHYSNMGTGADLYDGTNNLGIAFGVTIENAVGGSGNDRITGNHADNVLKGGAGNDFVDGGPGSDIALFSGNEHNYSIAPSSTGFFVRDNSGIDGVDSVINVEKLQFSDDTITIAATPDEFLLESYRIYKAAFDRAPDYEGLGFWYHNMEKSGAPLTAVAEGFINSDEFRLMYGASPADSTFLTLLYQHLLDRNPDQGGYDFWMNSLQEISKAEVLAYFSESAENKANIAGIISHGIIYQEWVG
jgi:serralysin